MESAPISFGQMRWLTEIDAPWPLITALSLVALVVLTSRFRSREPWSLSDPVPRIYNTIQFLTNNEKFMKRVM